MVHASRAFHRPFARHLVALAVCLSAAALPAWAQSNADPRKTLSCAPAGKGDLVLPPGMNIDRMNLLKEGNFFKVYTTVEQFDERSPSAGAMPASVAAVHDVSPSGLNRILQDVITRSKRFKVYDMRANVTAEHSNVLVRAKVIFANQTVRPGLEGGRRIVESQVDLSVQLIDMYTGENLLQSDVAVQGRTGTSTGDRVVLTANDDMTAPDIQRRLAQDFYIALQRAFALANYRLEELLRPIALVLDAQDCDVNLFGGSRFGLQKNDELVVFRVQTRKLGDLERIVRSTPVALIRCAAVGPDDTACKVVRSVPGYRPQADDYAIITDDSLSRTREL